MNNLDAFIAHSMEMLPVEAMITTRVFEAFKADGNPILSINDGEEITPVTDIESFNRIVFNLDECILNHRFGWVRIVLGNGWDSLVDYTANIETERVIEPINTWIETHW